MNLDYNPIEPDEGRKAKYGINYATQGACDEWLQHATNIVCSEQEQEFKREPEVEQASPTSFYLCAMAKA